MNEVALLQFMNAKGVGNATIHRLASFVARRGIAPSDVVQMSVEDMAAALGVTPDLADSVVRQKDSATRLVDELNSHGVDILWLLDEEYPGRLKAILGEDAPAILFAKGRRELLHQPAVGFCGSRKASEKGLDVTQQAARILADEHVCVISGYAHGVDMAAHRAALAVGGATVLVLVEGILRFQVKKGIEDVFNQGKHLILSQFSPRLPWMGSNAMRRNGTIIGLSDAMILVESGCQGGTFAAGTEALERRHPLFVIDFERPGPSAAANPYFIEHGGIPIRGNDERVPNLEKVLEVTRHPRWRDAAPSETLF